MRGPRRGVFREDRTVAMRHSRKTGDCSRNRRLYGSPARIRWYAASRAERLARRFGRH